MLLRRLSQEAYQHKKSRVRAISRETFLSGTQTKAQVGLRSTFTLRSHASHYRDPTWVEPENCITEMWKGLKSSNIVVLFWQCSYDVYLTATGEILLLQPFRSCSQIRGIWVSVLTSGYVTLYNLAKWFTNFFAIQIIKHRDGLMNTYNTWPKLLQRKQINKIQT